MDAKHIVDTAMRVSTYIAKLEAENANFCEEISNLTGAVDRLQKQLDVSVDLLEKSHAECNDLSNEKLEILDRLVRLESENATLKTASQKHSDLWFGARIKSSIFKK